MRRSGFTLVEGLLLFMVIAVCSYFSFWGGAQIQNYLIEKNNLELLKELFAEMRTDSMQNAAVHTLKINIRQDSVYLDEHELIVPGADFYDSTFKSESIVVRSLASGAFSKAGSIYFTMYGKHYQIVIPIGFSEVYIK